MRRDSPPESYGVATSRVDAREDRHKSRYNRRREMPAALQELIETLPRIHWCCPITTNPDRFFPVDAVSARFGPAYAGSYDYKRWCRSHL